VAARVPKTTTSSSPPSPNVDVVVFFFSFITWSGLPTYPTYPCRRICHQDSPSCQEREKQVLKVEKKRLTRQVPGLAFVEVDFGNGMDSEAAVNNLLGEVVGHKLLVRGVKAEARR